MMIVSAKITESKTIIKILVQENNYFDFN